MDVYQGWFNLREGCSDLEVAAAFEAYMGHLQERGMIARWRLLRRKLGLGPAMLGEFHFLIETIDLARLNAAFGTVSARARRGSPAPRPQQQSQGRDLRSLPRFPRPESQDRRGVFLSR